MTWTLHENGAGATPTFGRRRRRIALSRTRMSYVIRLGDEHGWSHPTMVSRFVFYGSFNVSDRLRLMFRLCTIAFGRDALLGPSGSASAPWLASPLRMTTSHIIQWRRPATTSLRSLVFQLQPQFPLLRSLLDTHISTALVALRLKKTDNKLINQC